MGKIGLIDKILNNEKIIKLYELIPDKESRLDFLETLLSHYYDRISEKLDERIQDEFSPGEREYKQKELKENKRDLKSIKGIIRSRKREPLREGVQERMNFLINSLMDGKYITNEDRDFIIKHLAKRGAFFGRSPSEERERVRNVLDKFSEAKNIELDNMAKEFENKAKINAMVMNKKAQLIRAYEFGWGESEIQEIKNELKELEELQESNDTSNILINTKEKDFDIEKNNLDLEELMNELDKEIANLKSKGIQEPDRGIDEIPSETEEVEASKNLSEIKAAINQEMTKE